MSADEIIIEYRTNKENELKDMQAWKRFLQEIKYDPKTATAEYIDNNGKKSVVGYMPTKMIMIIMHMIFQLKFQESQ